MHFNKAKSRGSWLLFGALCLFVLSGCQLAGASGMVFMVLASLGALFLSACSDDTVPATGDGGQGIDSGPGGPDAGDGGVQADGSFERCCDDGVISTCFCPAGAFCNYGLFTDCGGGRCEVGLSDAAHCAAPDGGLPDSGPPEAGLPDAPISAYDAGGTFEPCCTAGVVTTCFCPAGAACNYGLFINCGDGTCVAGVGFDAGGACTPDGGS